MHGIDLRWTEDEERDTDLLISTVDSTERRDEVITKVQIKAPQQTRRWIFISVKVDTGTNGNILTDRSFKQLYPQYADLQEKGILKPSKVRLTVYNGSAIKNIGTIELHLLDNTSVEWKPMIAYVCEADDPNILGLKACTAFGLVKLNCEVNTDKESHKVLTQYQTYKKNIQNNFMASEIFLGDSTSKIMLLLWYTQQENILNT